MKALVGAFNQEKALVGAFSVIVQPVVEQMEHYTALPMSLLSLSLAWRTRICSGCTASSFLLLASLLLASTLPRQYYDMMFWIKII